MDKTKQNIFFTFAGKVVAMLFWIALDVAAARFLKINAYAEWTFFFSILTMLFWIGWLGINISSKVYVAKYDNANCQRDCVKSAFVTRIAVSTFIGGVFIAVLPCFAENLGYPIKYPNLRWLFSIAGVLVFFNSISEFYKEVFMGINRFKQLLILTITEYSGYFFLSLLFLSRNKQVGSIAYGYIFTGIVLLIMGAVMLFLIYRNVGGNSRISYSEYIKPIMRYAIPIAVLSMGGFVLTEMDTFMLGILGAKEEVAVYGIAKSICYKAVHVNNASASGVMTTFAIINSENYNEKHKRYIISSRTNFALSIAVALCLILLGQYAVNILYGAEYTHAGHLIRLLSFYYVLFAISNYLSLFLDFRDKAGKRSIWYFSVVAINLVLNYILIPRYGAKGAAVATGISLIPYTLYTILASRNEWETIEKDIVGRRNDKRRIAFVINSLSKGGAERAVSNLSLHFPDNYEIDIILNDKYSIEYPYRGNIISLGLKPRKNKLNLRYQIVLFFVRYVKLRRLKKINRYDAVISFSESANIANILSGNRFGKTIISVRINLSSVSQNMLYKLFAFPAVRLLYNQADKVIAVSKGVGSDLIKNFNVNNDLVMAIPNGCDILKIKELASCGNTNEENEVLSHDGVIVTAGRLEHQKGQWHLIRALSILKDKHIPFKLLIMGDGAEESYLRGLVKELDMDKDVEFLGFKENPFYFFAHARLFVFPSLYEGMSNTLIEALACGVPCISTDHDSGAREILAPNTDISKRNKTKIEEAEFGLLIPTPDGIEYSSRDPLTSEEIMMAEAVETLLMNDALNIEYRRRAAQRIEEFSLESCIKEWLAVIENRG